MIVETKVIGSRYTERHDVPVHVQIGSLRDLLVLLTRHELESYERTNAASMTLRVLTPADLARGVDTGVYGREVRPAAAPPTERRAIERVIEAFGDGLFFAFLDGAQVENLDTQINIRPDSTFRLVRLVALAGG